MLLNVLAVQCFSPNVQKYLCSFTARVKLTYVCGEHIFVCNHKQNILRSSVFSDFMTIIKVYCLYVHMILVCILRRGTVLVITKFLNMQDMHLRKFFEMF